MLIKITYVATLKIIKTMKFTNCLFTKLIMCSFSQAHGFECIIALSKIKSFLHSGNEIYLDLIFNIPLIFCRTQLAGV